MKNIVICTGYMGSGSSAVTNLLSEINGYNNDNGEFEFVLMHAPDGVFDLEDKLLVGNNALRSDEAIHRFIKCMCDLYDKKHYWVSGYKNSISVQYMDYIMEYIHALFPVILNEKWNTWYYTENPNFWMIIKKIFNKLVKAISLNKIKTYNPAINKEMFLAYPTEKEFYDASKALLKHIYSDMGGDSDNLVLDQFILPHNLFRIHNYFDGREHVIVVRRDPRDVFLSNKYYWIKNNSQVNFPVDVELFCIMFDRMMKTEKKYKYDKVLELNFEDLIYKYDYTLQVVYRFLDINPEDHIRKGKVFIPYKSINNTQIFKIDDRYKEEAEYIEKHLKEYCYDFPTNMNSKRKTTEVF